MTSFYVTPSGDDSNDGLSEGNAFATPGKAVSVVTSDDHIYVKVGTYLCSTTTVNVSGGPPNLPATIVMEGYLATPGDLAGWPVISANGLAITTLCSVRTPGFNKRNSGYINIEADGTNTVSNGFSPQINYNSLAWRCKAKNCTNGFYMVGTSAIVDCYAADCTYGYRGNSQGKATRCWAENCDYGYYTFSSTAHCIAASCTSGAFYPSSIFPTHIHHCTAYNSPYGFYHTLDIGSITECLSVDCPDAFVWTAANSDPKCIRNAAYGATNSFLNALNHRQSIILTADPFVDGPGGNFTPNGLAGGGAALKLAGVYSQTGQTYFDYVGAIAPDCEGGGGGVSGYPGSRIVGGV